MLSLTDVAIFLAILIVSIYFYLTRNFNYWKSRGVPHEKPIVLFGNLLDIALGNESPGKYLANLYNKFEGPYFGFFALDLPHLVLKDPDLIKRVLIKDFQMFQNRFFVCDEKIDPVASNSLIGIRTPHWKGLRSKLSPIFSSGKIKAMLPLMKECGENLQNYIKTILDKDMEVKEIAAKYTTDVIASCAFGITANSFVNENSEFRVAGRNLFPRSVVANLQVFSYFFAPLVVKIFKFSFIPKRPVQFLRKVFTEALNQREIGKNKRNDLIDILIDLQNQETNDDDFKFYGDRLVAQAVIFFGAGHETTSSTIAFTLHELCVNTEIQDRLRIEILEVIAKHGDLTYEAVQDMKYLQMVVSETLRKYPLFPFIGRECSEDYKITETGLVIEKGTPIIIPQHGLHWDPKYFPFPEKFDPERFSDENIHNITSCVYLPFGDGPRICIGERFALLSTKLGLIDILRNFKVEKNSHTREPLVFTSFGLLQAKDGIRMAFQQL